MTVELLTPPSIEGGTSPWERTWSDHKKIVGHLGAVFAHLNTIGVQMIESVEPLTYEEWDNLLNWVFQAWLYQSKDETVASWFEAVIKRGIEDFHYYLTKLTTDDIFAEARQRGFLKSQEADDTPLHFWCNSSRARTWLNSIGYQFQRLRRPAAIEFSQIAMEKIAIPFALRMTEFDPSQALHTHWVEHFANDRFPEDKAAQADWVERIVARMVAQVAEKTTQ